MSAFTEEEARKKWCPFVRVLATIDGTGPQHKGPLHGFSYNRNLQGEPYGACVASACMSWRWKARFGTDPNNPQDCAVLPSTHGYCGLAGRPE
jgi:hypothetical protein